MKRKKIVFGSDKSGKNDINKQLYDDAFDSKPAAQEKIEGNEVPEAEFENVWSNDYKVIQQLSDNLKAEKRMYVRVRHLQQIECKVMYEDLDAEPVKLKKPITFTTVDISIGGIGIICDQPIKVNTILQFEICLDDMYYLVEYMVVYCLNIDDKYRIGLKIVKRHCDFIKHLKIYVARISLQSKYGTINTKPADNRR